MEGLCPYGHESTGSIVPVSQLVNEIDTQLQPRLKTASTHARAHTHNMDTPKLHACNSCRYSVNDHLRPEFSTYFAGPKYRGVLQKYSGSCNSTPSVRHLARGCTPEGTVSNGGHRPIDHHFVTTDRYIDIPYNNQYKRIYTAQSTHAFVYF